MLSKTRFCKSPGYQLSKAEADQAGERAFHKKCLFVSKNSFPAHDIKSSGTNSLLVYQGLWFMVARIWEFCCRYYRYVVSSTIVAHKRKYRRVFVRFIEQIFWSKKRKYRLILSALEIFLLSERDADDNSGDALSKSNGK